MTQKNTPCESQQVWETSGNKHFCYFPGVGLDIDSNNGIPTDEKKEAQRGKLAQGNMAHEWQDQASNPRGLSPEISWVFLFLFFKDIYLFIYLWLRRVLVAARALHCSMRASL